MLINRHPPETPFDFLTWIKSLPAVDSMQFAAIQTLVDNMQTGECRPEPPEHAKELLRSLGVWPKESQPNPLKMSECGLSKEELEAKVTPMPFDYYKWLQLQEEATPEDTAKGDALIHLVDSSPHGNPLLASDATLARFIIESSGGDMAEATPEAIAKFRENMYSTDQQALRNMLTIASDTNQKTTN